MTPRRDVGRFAVGVAVIVAWLVWWSPSIVLRLSRLAGLRVFHIGELALVEGLYALRRDRAARRLLARSIRRNRRALQVARERQRAATPH